MTDSTHKILVVDDEPQILKVLQAYLEKEGYQVVSATDGRSALDVFTHETPTFVISLQDFQDLRFVIYNKDFVG